MFADDTNITASGESINEVENAVNLDLENLPQMAHSKQTKFGRSKN